MQQVSSPKNNIPAVVIDAQSTPIINFRELWEYRELLLLLVWRQIIVKYKQTAVGIAWSIIKPLISIVVLTLVFNEFLNISSGDIPYPIFTLSAIIFWSYFSSAVTAGGQSLVSNAHLISKIYFPRLIVLISGCLSPLIDFLISLGILLLLLPFFGIIPSIRLVLLPVLLLATFMTAFSVSLWLSALNVRYRDIGHIIPFIIQIWMYLVPIIYPIDLVSESIRPIYRLNPMVGVVEGARWVLLNQETSPDFAAMITGLVAVSLLLVSGVIFFQHAERSFADIV